MAIMTRWRMPPESWCGYSCRRCSGDGQPHELEQLERPVARGRRDRRARGRAPPRRSARRSASSGSATATGPGRPSRCPRRGGGASPCRTARAAPGPRSAPSPTTVAVAGSRPMIARELTVLPEPDSPMSASVRPTVERVAEAVDGADACARRGRKSTRRSRTSSSGPSADAVDLDAHVGRGSRSSRRVPARAQRVAEEVEGQDGDEEEGAREQHAASARPTAPPGPSRSCSPSSARAAGRRGRGS